MYNELTIECFEAITAEMYDAGVDEVAPKIDRRKAKAALSAPFGGPGQFVLYSDPVDTAILCCVALIKSRPLSHGNKRVAYRCMQEMLARYRWAQFDAKPPKIAEMLDGLGDDSKSEVEFDLWVRAEIGHLAVERYERSTA
jgi:prophage maintenance system killer protein